MVRKEFENKCILVMLSVLKVTPLNQCFATVLFFQQFPLIHKSKTTFETYLLSVQNIHQQLYLI